MLPLRRVHLTCVSTCASQDYFDGNKFLTSVRGQTRATPLLLCLVCIELSDFVFAVDSIPAVLSISQVRFECYSSQFHIPISFIIGSLDSPQDPLVVIGSNVFGIVGLRSLCVNKSGSAGGLPVQSVKELRSVTVQCGAYV